MYFRFMESPHNTASVNRFEILPHSALMFCFGSAELKTKSLLTASSHQAKIQMLTAICSIVKLIP